jgi:hypothetical protein
VDRQGGVVWFNNSICEQKKIINYQVLVFYELRFSWQIIQYQQTRGNDSYLIVSKTKAYLKLLVTGQPRMMT